MASVGLFFGSDTGNTEHVAKMIQKELGKNLIAVHDIAKSSKEQITTFFQVRQFQVSQEKISKFFGTIQQDII